MKRAPFFLLVFVLTFSLCSCKESPALQDEESVVTAPASSAVTEPEVFCADVILGIQTTVFEVGTDKLLSVSTKKQEYNEYAHLIAQEIFSGEESQYRLTFENDENGNHIKASVQKTSATAGWFYQGPIAWEYDEENRLTRVETRIGEVLFYTCDSEGRLLSRAEGGVGTDSLTWREEYLYSSDGSYVKNTYYALNADEMGFSSVCEYDSRGRILKEICFNYFESGEVNQKYFYEYEEEANGNLVKQLKYDGVENNRLIEVVDCSYDSDGRVIKVTKNSVRKDGTYVVSKTYEVRYDEIGRVKCYVWENTERREEIRYEYGKIEVEKSVAGKDLTKYDIKDVISHLGI